MESSIVVSNIPCKNDNRLEEAQRADKIRYDNQIKELINDMSDEEEEDESCDESEDESDSERSSLSSISEEPKSMLGQQYERSQREANYVHKSQLFNSGSNLSDRNSDSERSSESCFHSYQTQTQGVPSELPSFTEDVPKNGHHTNGLSGVSSFLARNHRNASRKTNGHSEISGIGDHRNVAHQRNGHSEISGIGDHIHINQKTNGHSELSAEGDYSNVSHQTNGHSEVSTDNDLSNVGRQANGHTEISSYSDHRDGHQTNRLVAPETFVEHDRINIDKQNDHELLGYLNGEHDYKPHTSLQENYANSNRKHGYVGNGSFNTDDSEDLPEKFRSLQILYITTREELQSTKKSEQTYKNDNEQQKHIFEKQIYLLNDEKKDICSKLEYAQTIISDYEKQNKSLIDKVSSLENQLADANYERNEALSKLESFELTVHSLEKQLKTLQRSENLARIQDQNNRILENLKLRHQKDILQYKENVDELQAKLDTKVMEFENLSEKNSELHQKFEKLKKEKSEMFNKLSKDIEVYEERCQQYMKTDTKADINLLKHQLQQLQNENSYMDKQNEALKDEVKSLKTELCTFDSLKKLGISSQTIPKNLPESSNARTNEFQLENSQKIVKALRSENSDLKKELKNSKNEISQMIEKIQIYESQIAETKIESKELEEKLNYLTSSDTVTNFFHEKKFKSLEQEVQVLKANSHDLTKKLKEASSNENMLRENIEELQTQMGEMLQKMSEEKLQAVEECRIKYVELHENILKKEKEKLIAESQAELENVHAEYRNRIQKLQRENKSLAEGLNVSKSEYLAAYQQKKNLDKKLEQICKPKEREEIEREIRAEYEKHLDKFKYSLKESEQTYKSKDREEIEKRIQAEYEKQLGKTKEILLKQRDEYVKIETEKAQIEWTNKKMSEIKVFIENTKKRLDDEFKSCLEKERNILNQDLETEKQKLSLEWNEKIAAFKQRYEIESKEKFKQIMEREIEKQNYQLNQDFKYKLEKEIAALQEHQKKETIYLRNQYENKLSSKEEELKYLKERLSSKSTDQEEIEKLRQERLHEQRMFEKEKDLLKASERALNENLKTLVEAEKRMKEKLKQYKKHTIGLKKQHEDKVNSIQKKLADMQKNCNEKQDLLHLLKAQSEQQLMNLGDKVRKVQCRSSETQTEEKMISHQIVLETENKFFNCLQNISDKFREYLTQYRKRSNEKLHATLHMYHEHLYSKMLKDFSKDTQAFIPTVIIPRPVTSSTSQETLYLQQNEKFKTSTPGLFNSAQRAFIPPSNINQMPSAVKSASSPNLHRKATVRFSQNPEISSQAYFSTMYKTLTPTVDVMGSGEGNKYSGNIPNGNRLKDRMAEPGFDLGDVTFDFLPMEPTRMTNYGLFGSKNGLNVLKDSVPMRHLSKHENGLS